MDSNTEMDFTSKGEEFICVMNNFPCLFNAGMTKKPQQNRLKYQLRKIEQKVCAEQEEYKDHRMLRLNILCWIYFQLGDTQLAKEKNDESLKLDPSSLLSLGNQAFLEWYISSDSSKCLQLQQVQRSMTQSEFDDEKTRAKAEQAYFLMRLGGEHNLSLGITLYAEVTEKQPENYQWKYYYGQITRRLDQLRRDKTSLRAEPIFQDIAENSTCPRRKSLALSELAIISSTKKTVSVTHVEGIIQKALYLSNDNAIVYQNCGIAMKLKGDPRAISYLEEAISLYSTTVNNHLLAKCYSDSKLTRGKDRNECDRKAIHHFKTAYDLSMGDNVQPLCDFIFFLRCRNMIAECLEQCEVLIKKWSIGNILSNPFIIAKTLENTFYALKISLGVGAEDIDRYLAMAISTSLELFQRNASAQDKDSLFNQIINHDENNPLEVIVTKSLFGLLNCCHYPRCAKQILLRLADAGTLEEKEEINREVLTLLNENRPDESLLLLDLLDLRRNDSPTVTKDLERRVILEEATRELREGLVACKLLFHKVFNDCHFGHQMVSPDEEEAQGTADVLFLYDGPHWKPFLQHDTEDGRELLKNGQLNQVCEEVLFHLFDLEVISNPWFPFSKKNDWANELPALLQSHNIKLVLLLADEYASTKFLQFADCILAPILLGTATPTTTCDVAIVCGDVTDQISLALPNLRDARRFDARTNGLTRRRNDLSVEAMLGTEILDAYFSGSVENAIKFFNFLAPP